MQSDAGTKRHLALLSLPAENNRPPAVSKKRPLLVSEPVYIFAQSVLVSTGSWAIALYFTLLMYGFLWSWSDARELYTAIMDGKPINWVITAAVITAIVLHLRRLQVLRARRNPQPQYSPSVQTAAPRPRKFGGVYGRAHAATDHEIDAALRGKTGGFDPMFEE